MRIKAGSTFRVNGHRKWVKVTTLVTTVGQSWKGQGSCFQDQAQVPCTLVAWWGEGYEEPWFVITDLDPDACDVAWYGLRAWCEQGFKGLKRGGWQWQNTQMSDPERAARLWLAMAVATLWVISIGSTLEVSPEEEVATDTNTATNAEFQDLPDLRALLGNTPSGCPRRLRLFRLGWLLLLVRALNQQSIPIPQRLVPEPWPSTPPSRGGTYELHHAPAVLG